MTERILSNRYVLNEVIGTGGMAVVYRAWDRVQLREVAVKVLRAEYNADDEFVRRFNHEAHAASQMSHPNIVNMYDVGQDGDMRYIVMEYVKGRTLKDLIRQSGQIKPQRAVQMALRILAAVDHAHRSHIVHRDIKPQNILVDGEGNVKVADFGIARATNGSTMATLTDGDSVLGSVHYFSPEQASGQTADEKSDLYSVGVVLYEMVTGRVPFDGDTPVAVALKHVQEPPKSTRLFAPEVSRGLDEVVMKSLEKDGDRRYQNAADFANDLKRAIRYPKGGFVGELSQAEQQIKKAERREKRKKTMRLVRNYVIVGLCMLLLVLGLIYGRQVYRQVFARIKCPDLVYLDLEHDAIPQLEALGLAYTIEEEHNNDVKYGTILNQSPDPDTAMWPGEKVQLRVSVGKEKLTMPKLVELTSQEAAQQIEQSDLLLVQSDVKLVISDVPVGRVVKQEPLPNEWVKPGDRVKLWISGESALVPSVMGMSLQEGKEALVAAGFQPDANVIEKLSQEEPGTIIEQSVEAGSPELLSTKIQLTVSYDALSGFRAQKTLIIAIPEGGADVRCTLIEAGQESDQLKPTHYSEAGNKSIQLNLEAQTAGVHTMRVYVNEVLTVEEQIEFG